jgi:hypothetical protein
MAFSRSKTLESGMAMAMFVGLLPAEHAALSGNHCPSEFSSIASLQIQKRRSR